MGDERVADALRSYGIEKYIATFVEQEIDYFSFLRLHEDDLKEMNIPIGPRKKIMDHIRTNRPASAGSSSSSASGATSDSKPDSETPSQEILKPIMSKGLVSAPDIVPPVAPVSTIAPAPSARPATAPVKTTTETTLPAKTETPAAAPASAPVPSRPAASPSPKPSDEARQRHLLEKQLLLAEVPVRFNSQEEARLALQAATLTAAEAAFSPPSPPTISLPPVFTKEVPLQDRPPIVPESLAPSALATSGDSELTKAQTLPSPPDRLNPSFKVLDLPGAYVSRSLAEIVTEKEKRNTLFLPLPLDLGIACPDCKEPVLPTAKSVLCRSCSFTFHDTCMPGHDCPPTQQLFMQPTWAAATDVTVVTKETTASFDSDDEIVESQPTFKPTVPDDRFRVLPHRPTDRNSFDIFGRRITANLELPAQQQTRTSADLPVPAPMPAPTPAPVQPAPVQPAAAPIQPNPAATTPTPAAGVATSSLLTETAKPARPQSPLLDSEPPAPSSPGPTRDSSRAVQTPGPVVTSRPLSPEPRASTKSPDSPRLSNTKKATEIGKIQVADGPKSDATKQLEQLRLLDSFGADYLRTPTSFVMSLQDVIYLCDMNGRVLVFRPTQAPQGLSSFRNRGVADVTEGTKTGRKKTKEEAAIAFEGLMAVGLDRKIAKQAQKTSPLLELSKNLKLRKESDECLNLYLKRANGKVDLAQRLYENEMSRPAVLHVVNTLEPDLPHYKLEVLRSTSVVAVLRQLVQASGGQIDASAKLSLFSPSEEQFMSSSNLLHDFVTHCRGDIVLLLSPKPVTMKVSYPPTRIRTLKVRPNMLASDFCISAGRVLKITDDIVVRYPTPDGPIALTKSQTLLPAVPGKVLDLSVSSARAPTRSKSKGRVPRWAIETKYEIGLRASHLLCAQGGFYVSAKDNVYHVSTQTSAIKKMIRSGPPVQEAAGLAFSQGKFYVCDRSGASIHMYTPNWAYAGSLPQDDSRLAEDLEPVDPAAHGVNNEAPLIFSKPCYCHFDSAGSLVVSDSSFDRVLFLRGGVLHRSVGGSGEALGQLHHPLGLATDTQGQLYVCDFGNDRVQVFDSQGAVLAAIQVPSPLDIIVWKASILVLTKHNGICIFG